MKRLNLLAMVACAGVVGLTPGIAQSSATALGTNCVEQYPYNLGLVYTTAGVSSANYSEGTRVTCPIAVAHDLGSTAQFEVVVKDRDPGGNFSCFAVAYNPYGVYQSSSPVETSSGSSGSAATLSMSISGVNPGSSWAFAVVCNVPAEQSELVSMRAY